MQLPIDADVEFIVIGGWSAIFHGSAHLTQDLELISHRRRENMTWIAAA